MPLRRSASWSPARDRSVGRCHPGGCLQLAAALRGLSRTGGRCREQSALCAGRGPGLAGQAAQGARDLPEVELWQALRAVYGEQMVAGLAEVAAALAGDPSPRLPDKVVAHVRVLTQSEAPVDLVNGLTERFVDSARRAGSDQVTPERIVRAVRHFAPELPSGGTVFDPACGTGVLLLSVAPGADTRCCGQEADADSARFAQVRADVLGRTQVSITAGDSLRADAWPDLRLISSSVIRRPGSQNGGGRSSSSTPAGNWAPPPRRKGNSLGSNTLTRTQLQAAMYSWSCRPRSPIERRAAASGRSSCAEESCARWWPCRQERPPRTPCPSTYGASNA